MTNPNNGTQFLFSRGPILTIGLLNLDKGRCIFELKATCEQKDRSTQKRNWTPMDGYKYKSSDPHLDMIIMIILRSLGLAHTSPRLGRRGCFIHVWDCKVWSLHMCLGFWFPDVDMLQVKFGCKHRHTSSFVSFKGSSCMHITLYVWLGARVWILQYIKSNIILEQIYTSEKDTLFILPLIEATATSLSLSRTATLSQYMKISQSQKYMGFATNWIHSLSSQCMNFRSITCSK